MAIKTYCEGCERKVTAEPVPVNSLFYLIITIISFGIGFILWGLAAMSANDRYRCPICKDNLTNERNEAIKKDKEEAKRKAKESKEQWGEFVQEHGLPWLKWRIPLLLLCVVVFFILGFVDVFIELDWWVYLPLWLFLLPTLFGVDILFLRNINGWGDWQGLLFPLVMVCGVAAVGALIDFAVSWLIS